MLQLVEKQVCKLELSKRWRIYDVFHVSLLEQDTTRKEQEDIKILQLEYEDNSKGKEYEVEAICDSLVYVMELKSSQLLGLYY